MRIFTLSKDYSVVCNFKSTRSGFKHEASLHKNGLSIYQTKICYLNRTWEAYEYESILHKVIDENFTGAEKQNFLEVIKNEK
jgi:hypothetical protein